MPPIPKAPVVLTKMWDIDIGARLLSQSTFLFVDAVMGKEKDAFMEILMGVAHKQQAMRYHVDLYRRLEVELYNQHVAEFAMNPNVNSESFPLIYAFESFVFQLKSALDLLVKTLSLIPFKKAISTQTYGNKGEGVLRGLRSNQEELLKLMARGKAPDGARWIARIEPLVDLIQKAREGWLGEAVDVRDTVSHFKGANNFVFLPVEIEGRYEATRPMFERNNKRMLPLPFMEGLLAECLSFCQDFACRVMAFRMHIQGIELGPADSSMAVAFSNEEYAKFIKWGWQNEAGEMLRGYYKAGQPE